MPEPALDRPAPLRLGAVILAAGASSRMGSVKQLLSLDGRPLVVRAAEAALGAGARPVAVVLGAHAESVGPAVAALPVLAVLNPDWRDGLASSIRAGLAALLAAEPGLDAVLLAPCDQPALSAAAIGRLAALHRETGLVAAARYGGRNAAPAVFGRDYFIELQSLAGDEGARRMLNAGDGAVAALLLPELEADLDTPSDAAAWRARHEFGTEPASFP